MSYTNHLLTTKTFFGLKGNLKNVLIVLALSILICCSTVSYQQIATESPYDLISLEDSLINDAVRAHKRPLAKCARASRGSSSSHSFPCGVPCGVPSGTPPVSSSSRTRGTKDPRGARRRFAFCFRRFRLPLRTAPAPGNARRSESVRATTPMWNFSVGHHLPPPPRRETATAPAEASSPPRPRAGEARSPASARP